MDEALGTTFATLPFIAGIVAAVLLISRRVASSAGKALCLAFICLAGAFAWWIANWAGDSCSDQFETSSACSDLETVLIVMISVWVGLLVLVGALALRRVRWGNNIDDTAPAPGWHEIGAFPPPPAPRPADDPGPRPSGLSRSSKLVVAVVVVAAAAVIVAKPVGIFGWDAESLASSVARELGDDFGNVECRQDGRRAWRCLVETDPGSAWGALYRAFPGENGCWTAQPVERGPFGTTGNPTASECVDIVDLLDAIG
jgi:hypothetical protein